MSAAAPVRRTAQGRRPATFQLPVIAPDLSAPAHKPTAIPRPRLVLVSAHRTMAGRLPFLIVVGGVLVIGLVGVLLLHTVAAQDAFRVTSLTQQLASLTDQEQQEAQLVAADSSPTALQARAEALGMVPTSIAKLHRLRNGRTVGVQAPLYVPPAVVVKPATPAKHANAASTPALTKTSTKPKTTTTTTTSKAGKPANTATSKHHARRHPKR